MSIHAEALARAKQLFAAGIYARYTWGQGKAVRGTNHTQLADLPPTYEEIARVDYSGGLAILNGTPHPAGGYTHNIDVDDGPLEWAPAQTRHLDWLLIEEGTGPGKWHITVRTKDQLTGQIDLRPADNPRGKAVAEIKGKGITALRSYPTLPPGKPKGYTPRYLAAKVEGEPQLTIQQVVDLLCAFYLRAMGKPVVAVRQGTDENGRGRGPLPNGLAESVEQTLEVQGAKMRTPRPNGWQQGYCPFHDDREASLSVNFDKNAWKCFAGCGAGSLWSLAERLGIPLPQKTKPASGADNAKSRVLIRDSDWFFGQEGHGHENGAEQGGEAAPKDPVLVDIATERAADWMEWARGFIPVTDDMEVHGASSFFRHKDNGRHLVTHAGLSDTWNVTGNAQHKRQRYLAFYTAGFQWTIKEQETPIYLHRYKLHPDAVEEDRTHLRLLQQRVRSKGGNYLKATCLYPEEEGGGCWVHFYSDVEDSKVEMERANAGHLIDTFIHVAKIPDFYAQKHPVRASDDWRMRRARTGEWELVGTRAIYDLRGYHETIDPADEEKAAAWNIKTWKASEQEMMGRAPERIMFTRHFLGPESISDEEMLVWAQGLGVRLLPHALDEVDRVLDPKAVERRAATRAMKRQERKR